MTRYLVLVMTGACAHAAPTGLAPSPTAAVASPSCGDPAFRQFDFWLGDWDLVVHARSAPTSQWADARGHQRVEAILGGCAIAEHFTADGPPTPWAGASYSMWQPQLANWRQTWVDDSGSFLAFTGGIEHGAMTLYGEPRDTNGKPTQMRMVFLDVTGDSLRWEWQLTEDNWATAVPMITIDYRRSPKR